MARKKKKKKKKSLPKARGVWGINPKTRVKPSAKLYKRKGRRKAKKSWVEDLFWPES